jgi:5-methylcytosine-specific restriction protein A
MKLLKGQALSNKEISRIFDVCTNKGIRYKGSLKTKIQHVVLIATFEKSPEDLIRNPYNDRKIDGKLLYTGEGRYGNQKMNRGNLVLKRQMKENYPLYVFEKKAPGNFVFLGQYKVLRVKKRFQADLNGEKRKVFAFELSEVTA